MKTNLLFTVIFLFPLIIFSQTFPLHKVDDCKVIVNPFLQQASFASSVPNPDTSVYTASNVSSLSYFDVPDQNFTFSRAFFTLPKSLEVNSILDWSGRFFSASSGSAGTGSGRFRIQLTRQGLPGVVNLGTFDKVGGSWQLNSDTNVTLTTGNPTNDANIDAAGGFDQIVIWNYFDNTVGTIEDFFFDDIRFSTQSYPPLENVDADLLNGNYWVYNNRPGDNQSVFGGSSPLGGNNATVTLGAATPSTEGNSALEAIEVVLTAGFSGIRFPITPIDPPFSGTVSYRFYNSTCTPDFSDVTSVTIRKDFDTPSQFTSSNFSIIETNLWTEVSFDLSTLTGTSSGQTGYNQLLIGFTGNSAADGSVYYIDAVQMPDPNTETYTYTGSWDVDPIGVSTAADIINVQSGTAVVSGKLIGNSLTVASGATLELDTSSVLNIINDITNNGTIVFKSDATGSAQLDSFTGTVSGSGTFTTERYISANRAYRLLASPVTTSNFISNNWQQDTHISGAVGTVGQTSPEGFDETDSGRPSMFTFDNSNANGGIQEDDWQPIPNTNATNLLPETPYLLFVRGDRTVNLAAISPATETTLSATGSIFTNTSTQTLNENAQEFSLIANPYQAIVDFNALTFGGIVNTNFMYVYDPVTRNYVTLENGIDTQDMFINPGQSVFVVNKANNGASSITFEPSDISVSRIPPPTAFSQEIISIAQLELYNSNNELSDLLKLRFSEYGLNSIDNFDAKKLMGSSENLASTNSDNFYAIERRAFPENSDVIPLYLNNYQDTNYEFKIDLRSWDDSIGVFIEDNYLNTTTEINTTQPYVFNIDNNIPESFDQNRFSLILNNTTLSTENNTFDTGFNLYPNPTSNGNFSIRTSGIEGEVDVQISNLLGQQIFQQIMNIESSELNVNVDDISAGIYFVKINKNGLTYTDKLIVK